MRAGTTQVSVTGPAETPWRNATTDRAGVHPPRHLRRALRLVGWNVSLLAAGLALIGLAGEAWLRLTTPFFERDFPRRFVPGVGVVWEPDTEVRWTNHLDFWTVSQTSSLGFLDREPPAPERAAASCHVAVIGDSFVEAREVAVADKFHVRLEALAARELPHLDVTTSAFGMRGTGQVAQLPFYDEYARHLHPRLLVLVAYLNDVRENSAILSALDRGWDPDRIPYVSASRNEDGKIGLHPPHPDMAYIMAHRTASGSFLVDWLYAREWREAWEGGGETLSTRRRERMLRQRARAESFRRRPRYARLLDGWRVRGPRSSLWVNWRLGRLEGTPDDPKAVRAVGLPPWSRDALETTGFALDQFKARADRDGATVVVLATSDLGSPGDGRFDGLNAMAAARGFPVVSQHDYVIRQGGRVEDASWPHDTHWTPTGHRWAAEALLEWLREHQDVCEPRAS